MEDKNQYGVWRLAGEEELQVEDVWDVLDDGYGHGHEHEHDQSTSEIDKTSDPSFPFQRSRPRVIPRTTTSSVRTRQHSAPVNVPDWSRVHRGKPKKAASSDDDDDDDVSPEAYFMGRIRSPSFSVIEGAGRTLKGRDLSKVRNAVLKKTGFLE
ncbi:PREDICTED: uncharacterized protein LOC104817669 [Tarenaya hassleriana]|uniref:uncharacterized protein LOC104817669 n=1 Tax=Tarenaya hassleriana TaxID=28532 RepID=UPI00053C2D4C|nr:PREDICTED: uncharacterized protein LOC104817669 [Tarenaya hassleriana]